MLVLLGIGIRVLRMESKPNGVVANVDPMLS